MTTKKYSTEEEERGDEAGENTNSTSGKVELEQNPVASTSQKGLRLSEDTKFEEGKKGVTTRVTDSSDGESSHDENTLTPAEDTIDTTDIKSVGGDEVKVVDGVQESKAEVESSEVIEYESADAGECEEGDKKEEEEKPELKEEATEDTAQDSKEESPNDTKAEEAKEDEAVVQSEGETTEEAAEEPKSEEEAEAAAEEPAAEEPNADKSIFGEDEDWSESLLDDQDPETALDDSPARLEWLTQKREQNEKNEHLDRMMGMVGHEDVKAHFLAVKTKVEVAKRWGEDLKELDLDLLLHGNNGTGKKKIAQIYAEFLFSIGAVCRRSFQRTTRHYMPPEGDQTVIYFSRGDDINQDSEITAILERVNASPDKMVLILSYQDFSSGSRTALKSSAEASRRFSDPIRLSNYNDKDSREMMRRLITQRAWNIEGGLTDAVSRCLARQVLRKHEDDSYFKNIQHYIAELDVLSVRQARRYATEWVAWAKSRSPVEASVDEAGNPLAVKDDRPTKDLFTRTDIYGPEPTDTRDKSEAWKELQKMVGLENVKKEIGHLFSLSKVNYYRGIQGKDPLPISLNRVFVGASGVGKTTVAQIYGKILGELGLVSKGGVTLKNPTHLIGTTFGSSEKKTREALQDAMGGTLIIDDAHMLYHAGRNRENDSDIFRLAVVDTLVANVLGKAGEDRCVILVGYEDKMESFLLKSNPGLQRRFPWDDALKFQGYNDDQLCAILDAKLAEDEVTASEHGLRIAREILSRARTRPQFGNGGDVENLLVRTRLRQRQRLEAAGIDRVQMLQEEHPLEAIDFDPDFDRASQADGNRDSLFHEFVGFDKIMKQFQGYQQMANGLRRLKIDPRTHIPWAFVFKGPPGTGKTSTARKVGKLFYDMGFLATDEVVDCSVTDLVGSWQGHTGPKVINQLELGLGKVLFIDEAYRLAPGGPETSSVNFKNEAIGEIVDAMTKPRYAGNMVIILAGYTEDMENLLRSNQGLRSRFPTHVNFQHMEPHSCLQLLKQQLNKLKIQLEIPTRTLTGGEEKLRKVHRLFAKLSATKGWANGRDIETLGKNIITNVFMNVGRMSEEMEVGELSVSSDALVGFLKDMLRERKTAQEDDDS